MDRELVVRAQGGDVDAFSALTAGRTGRLYGAARLILHDDDEAADAVQDALLRAWLDLRALRDPDRFDAWLHRLLVRGCYKNARKDRARQVTEIGIPTSWEPSVREDQQAVAIHDQLDRGFRRLSTDQRAVIVLYHYLGLSLHEAADALGIPLGTMQSRLSRATALMRASIEADERSPKLVAEGTR